MKTALRKQKVDGCGQGRAEDPKGEVDRTRLGSSCKRLLSLLKTPFSPLQNEYPDKPCLCGRSLHCLELRGPWGSRGSLVLRIMGFLSSWWLS